MEKELQRRKKGLRLKHAWNYPEKHTQKVLKSKTPGYDGMIGFLFKKFSAILPDWVDN